jgi:diguanylate cyclase (GGDEF)-like protein
LCAGLHACSDAVLIAKGPNQHVVFANQAAAVWLDLACQELLTHRLGELFDGVDWATELGNDTQPIRVPLHPAARDGGTSDADRQPDVRGARIGTVCVDSETLVLVAAAGRTADEQAKHSRDALTGLPDRAAILHGLNQHLASADRSSVNVAVLFIDLNEFKDVNDRWGHLVGDVALATVAQRMAKCIRGEDLLGRYGGDEFVAILPHVTSIEAAAHVADRIRQSLRAPVEASGMTIPLSASIGVAIASGETVTPEELLHTADRQMYLAKESLRTGGQFGGTP